MTSFNGVQARDSVLDLRQYLETLLADELGVITSTNTPAVWVEPPFMTERTATNGVALIFARHEKNLSQQHVVSAPQATQQFDWEVVIRAYDKSAQGLVPYDRAIAKMRQAFSQFREIMLDSSEDVFPQVRYLLGSSRVINLLPKF